MASATGTRRAAIIGAVELAATVVVAIGLAYLIQALIVKPYRIPSTSMVPTLRVGQRILVDRLDTHPGLGDVVVFHPPVGADPVNPVCGDGDEGTNHPRACDEPTAAESGQTFVKRVVGLPGDHLRIIDGHVFRDGVQERGAYIQPCEGDPDDCTFPATIVVPPGHYFMMGDNRAVSDDSRFWGPIPQRWVIGVAFFTYWPPHRVGGL